MPEETTSTTAAPAATETAPQGHVSKLPTGRPGRPRNVKSKVVGLIGQAGYEALIKNDLFVVSGAFLEEGALVFSQALPDEVREAIAKHRRSGPSDESSE